MATNLADVAGMLEVKISEDPAVGWSERWFRVLDDKTGEYRNVLFETPPEAELLCGMRVRVRGVFLGDDIVVPSATTNGGVVPATASARTTGMDVLSPPIHSTKGLRIVPNVLYSGGPNTNTVIHNTLAVLVNFALPTTNDFTVSDLITYSNLLFGASNSVNACYLEDSYGAIGFAGNVVLCQITTPSNSPCNESHWMAQANDQLTIQGVNTNGYAHYVYIWANSIGACGTAGGALIGGNWVTISIPAKSGLCHELGHNLGFQHASSLLFNTNGFDEYGDNGDFMGTRNLDIWQHNNAPHKCQMGWVTPQPLVCAGTYVINRLEDVPGRLSYPQVLRMTSNSNYGNQAAGWPYYFSYRQFVGYDAYLGGLLSIDPIRSIPPRGRNYGNGLSIHRWNGGHSMVIATLFDGETFTDSQIGLTVRQLSHDANTVTVVITTCTGAAQPYSLVASAVQLAARTPFIADVATGCDFMTIAGFDATSVKGGSVTQTNNQLVYTPPGNLMGNDSFSYTLINSGGQQSTSSVTVFNLTQPVYVWNPTGVTDGSGTWNVNSTNWSDGVSPCCWPTNGGSCVALFQGTSGAVSIASPGVAVKGLHFASDGYLVQSNPLTLQGNDNWIRVEPYCNATIQSTLTGSASLAKSGSGTLTLSGSNALTGGITLSAGTLQQTTPNALGYAAITLGDSNTAANNLVWEADSGGTITNPATVVNKGTGSVTLRTQGGVATVFSGAMTFNRPLVLEDLTGVQAVFKGPISGNPGLLTLAGNQIVFSASNSFLGNLFISSGCTFQSTLTNALPPTTSVTNNGGSWLIGVAGITKIDGLSGFGAISGAIRNANLCLGNNGGDGAYYGSLLNQFSPYAFSLTKNGTGLQILGGTNTYTGPTLVNNGILRVSGMISTGAVTTSSAGTLSGAGTIQGPVFLNSGATLAPGNSDAPGCLTISNSLILSPNATVVFNLNKTNAPHNSDSLLVTGPISATNALLTVLNQGPALAPGDRFQLFNQPVTGFKPPILPPGYVWTNQLAVDGSLQVLALVPPQIAPAGVISTSRPFRLEGSGGGRQTYILLTATNLTAPVWVPIATNMADIAGIFHFSNVLAAGSAGQFFRVQTP